MIFDRTVVIKQLNVVEAHGLLLFRGDKGNTHTHTHTHTHTRAAALQGGQR